MQCVGGAGGERQRGGRARGVASTAGKSLRHRSNKRRTATFESRSVILAASLVLFLSPCMIAKRHHRDTTTSLPPVCPADFPTSSLSVFHFAFVHVLKPASTWSFRSTLLSVPSSPQPPYSTVILLYSDRRQAAQNCEDAPA